MRTNRNSDFLKKKIKQAHANMLRQLNREIRGKPVRVRHTLWIQAEKDYRQELLKLNEDGHVNCSEQYCADHGILPASLNTK